MNTYAARLKHVREPDDIELMTCSGVSLPLNPGCGGAKGEGGTPAVPECSIRRVCLAVFVEKHPAQAVAHHSDRQAQVILA